MGGQCLSRASSIVAYAALGKVDQINGKQMSEVETGYRVQQSQGILVVSLYIMCNGGDMNSHAGFRTRSIRLQASSIDVTCSPLSNRFPVDTMLV